MIAKIVAGAASASMIVAVGVIGSAPAGADPSAFGTLTCGCQTKAPAGSQIRRDEITRGIRQSLADWSPEPPRQLSGRTR